MAEILNLLSETVIPQIFGIQGALGLKETVRIIRVTTTASGYGDHAETETVTASEIPADYKARAGSNFTPGAQWTRHVFTMPSVFEGEIVDVSEGDKIKMLERGLQPERTFYIKEIRRGIVLEIECSASA